MTQDHASKQALPGPAMEAGCLAQTLIQSLANETGILGGCLSCMTAQTMVRQLVSVWILSLPMLAVLKITREEAPLTIRSRSHMWYRYCIQLLGKFRRTSM
jgi:hypothetical protein